MATDSDQLDRQMLDLAARIACRAEGYVGENPMVGAVLVRDGRIIGMGHHRRFGGLHAEREAIEDCRRSGNEPHGATMYVTLEPCAHTGKQPPCTDLLVQAGVAEVVCARKDPNAVAAGGAERLRAAGIPVRFTNVSAAALCVSDAFVKRVTTGLPWVIAKWAQTIDGRIATRSGESKWISSDRSRRRVHQIRARVDAVLTGMGTVLADNPLLTARDVRKVRSRAIRVVADSDLDIPETCELVRTAKVVPTIAFCEREFATAEIAREKRERLVAAGVRVVGVGVGAKGTGVDLREVLQVLASEFKVCSVLVEAGPGLIGSMIDGDLLDELRVYVAPLMLGDEMARSAAAGRIAPSLSAAHRYELMNVKQIENDLEVIYRRRGRS
ncbi:MAG: bifunctional diaminohydroxyphosphoribosylaminopyrimidine deaminase/5-amino-6-(5-phosphoribosylamino)uracil reductase RibD [Phycisphaeraceae bacterium]|nr:bifunctional diaminohydroxyphosphoribosylaminopyrimidine deaminase/5-amino-6-(5-phosphoribosylamino)uracil reductase RibD [Phycisphaeraceae bacterium]